MQRAVETFNGLLDHLVSCRCIGKCAERVQRLQDWKYPYTQWQPGILCSNIAAFTMTFQGIRPVLAAIELQKLKVHEQ